MGKRGKKPGLPEDVRKGRVIKFTDLEWIWVEEKAKEAGLTPATFVRKQALKDIPLPMLLAGAAKITAQKTLRLLTEKK